VLVLPLEQQVDRCEEDDGLLQPVAGDGRLEAREGGGVVVAEAQVERVLAGACVCGGLRG